MTESRSDYSSDSAAADGAAAAAAPSSSNYASSPIKGRHRFRLLPELDEMAQKISDLELEQTRLEAARARAARKESALAAVEKARRDAVDSLTLAQQESAHSHKTADEIEAERVAAVQCASSAEESFTAEYEAAFTVAQLQELLRREETLILETATISEESRRFAHFAELGAIASPIAKAAIYHLWDVDARNQPCRCASCGVILLLKKQYIGDKLIQVFCAKCTAAHHRDCLFQDNLALQEFYLRRTFTRIDDEFREQAKVLGDETERQERRAVMLEEELQRELILEVLFRNGPQKRVVVERRRAAVGVL